MALSIYDPRLLIATVNSPDLDESLRPPFILANFFSAPEATESDTVDILRRTTTRGLASFTASGAAANVAAGGIEEVIATVKFPFIREKTPIKASDLVALEDASRRVYRTTPETQADRQNRIIATYLTNLKNRAMRREQWMISELLTKGIVTYKEGKIAFKIDFGIDAGFLPVLSGTARWGQSAAAIAANLSTWTGLINGATGGWGGDVVLGENAAALFMADATIKAELDNNNLQAGRLILDNTRGPNSGTLGTYAGFTFHRWAETYLADDGVTVTPFFPTNGALLIGSTFQGRRLFGLNEEFVDGMRPADPYFSKTWDEPDPAVKFLLLASRPLPLAEQEGSWVYATVAG